ncbi:zinc-binding protein [Caulifigura coniformis]|uniref:DNA gyrase inhibitor YacG n=1 Tax=Caulifigura coniformis TaxID=2527983 RepID=A0A517SJR0_9PLAN|nr:DNA gyrase inhibitor YacG [Caulifigura coniformis]QDT56362.1 zinc-binding protein [Caulifigura coniformis]
MRSTPSTCAICGTTLEEGAAVSSPIYPFCSVRCKQIDLLRWCDGRYTVVNDMDPDLLLELGERMGDQDESPA